MNIKKATTECLKILFILLAALLYAFNINNFLHSSGLLAGGFTGLTLLIQQIFSEYLHIAVPFSVIYIPINAIPAIISFKFIGKRFTVYSLIFILFSSIFTDIAPSLNLTDDILLCAVFGGILNGTAISMCLLSGATSGGTDFISIFISEKYGKDAWSYIFAGNVVILLYSGVVFSWKGAMYSIILQFVSTMIIQMLYKHYQKQTLFIITEKPEEVYEVIRKCTNHDGTLFKGVGLYKGKQRNMIYSVVSSDEIHHVISEILKVDENAFINVTKSEMVHGRFYYRPK